jgi:hypothetical protein
MGVDWPRAHHPPRMLHPLDPVAHLADSHGVLLRREAIAGGVDDDALRRLVKARRLVRMRQGAYCLAEPYLAADEAERHRLLCRAVMRLYGEHVALSHASSCLAQGGPDYGLDLGSAHLTHLHGRGRRQARVIHHLGEVRVGDLRRVGDWWVTVPARAVFEVTCVNGSEAGLVQANHFLKAGTMMRAELTAFFGQHGRWPGSLRQHAVTLLASDEVESVGESRCQWCFWTQGLPFPVPQYEVRHPDGRLAAVVDFAWPERKVIVEFDGMEKYHRMRRPGETIEQMVVREKKREDLIRRLTGWTVIRLTWADLRTPVHVARVIRSAFAIGLGL